jgi:hypothetical protein
VEVDKELMLGSEGSIGVHSWRCLRQRFFHILSCIFALLHSLRRVWTRAATDLGFSLVLDCEACCEQQCYNNELA